MKLTNSEQEIVKLAGNHFAGGAFTPTQMGMAMGHPQVSASSRVAPMLRSLVTKGVLVKEKLGHNRAEYRLK